MTSTNYLAYNLKLLLKLNNLSGNDLSNITRVPPATIHKVRSGVITNPTIDTLLPLANYFKITLEDFLHTKLTGTQDLTAIANTSRIPLIELKNADNITSENIIRYIGSDYQAREKAFFISIPNDGMFFAKDSLLLVDKSEAAKSHDYVIVKNRKSTLVSVKKIIFDDKYYLASIVTGLETQLYDYNEYIVIGVVVGHFKYFRKWYN